MNLDVVDLRDFYASSLGQAAARVLRRALRDRWGDVKGLSVLGLGYATPILTPLRGEAERTVAAMPAQQGVLHWPAEGGNRTALVDELELPFPDLSIDRVVLLHAVEMAERPRALMREIWRVLAGNGRLLVMAPNRRGVWARLERTPFGHGQPYSAGQLNRLLRETMFMPFASRSVLFLPPTRSRMLLAAAPAWEEIGQRWFARFGGVVVIEATKQIYAGQPVPERRRRYLPLPSHPSRA